MEALGSSYLLSFCRVWAQRFWADGADGADGMELWRWVQASPLVHLVSRRRVGREQEVWSEPRGYSLEMAMTFLHHQI